MEKKIFKTLVQEVHKLGKNKYVQGRISGMMNVICNKNNTIEHGVGYIPNVGHIYVAECTESEYKKFAHRVEEYYPGLCKFDYKD